MAQEKLQQKDGARKDPHPENPPSLWQILVRELPGVGEVKDELLRKLEIRTVADLLYHRPRRYEDRNRFSTISSAQPGQTLTLQGEIFALNFRRIGYGKCILDLILNDGTGNLLLRWFNIPYLRNYFAKGQRLVVHGTLKRNSKKELLLDHPEFETLLSDEQELIHINRIVPIYPATENLSQRFVRALIWRVLEKYAAELPDVLPQGMHPLSLRDGLRKLHFPEAIHEAEQGRERIALEELFLMQVGVQQRRHRIRQFRKGIAHQSSGELLQKFLDQSGFTLTRAQTRCISEIRKDLQGIQPMNRLLQGDVGSGKTLVAILAMLTACESGYESVLLAPTEILAEQHYKNLVRWLTPLGVPIALATGSKKVNLNSNPETELPLAPLNRKYPAIFVGTHALLEEKVTFQRLGLVVVDEQHKFGVAQRHALALKGSHPDVLVMTATPIPRTLGLTVYGDLDVSIIDELPAGRGVIQTRWVDEGKLPEVWAFVLKQIAQGRQVFVVYPLVKQSDKSELKSAVNEFEHLKNDIFKGCHVGLLHGQMKGQEKEEVMRRFVRNEIQILVSTTVIEVGIDVPNANVMVVENAERFGLAQLHQLRGRIGRGPYKSYCILQGAAKSQESWKRLRIMEETTDGFRLAEEDLKIRGPGDFFGTQQSGLPSLQIADLVNDFVLLERARSFATQLVQEDPELQHSQHALLLARVKQFYCEKMDYFNVG